MTGFRIVLILFFFFSSFLFSCEEEQEGCGPTYPYFEIQSLQPHNLKFTNQRLNPWAEIEPAEVLNWQDYFIRVEFEATYIASTPGYQQGANLCALSCFENGYAGSTVGLDALTVITINEYNENYAAGDTVNDIVLTNDWTYLVEDYEEFVPVSQYIKDSEETISDQTFEVRLTEAPQEDLSTQQFKIVYHLENGDLFETITDVVTLRE